MVAHKADVNIDYPESLRTPAFTKEEVEEEDENYNPSKDAYKTTLLINVVRHNQKYKDVMRENVLGLMSFGARLDIVDSDGRDPLIHAVIHNNENMVKLILDNKQSGKL